MKEYAFGIDLGGTTAKIGLFKTTGELLEKWEVPTDTSNAGEHILENLAAAVQGKMQEKGLAAAQVEGVGVGVPGPVLDSRIVPIICANLGGWGKHNVAEELSTMLGGIRVLVGNDANVAALGEIWMGAAKGCRSAVMVTLGTGVGGGVIVNGQVIDGTHGAGGEIGHITVDRHETAACGCGAASRFNVLFVLEARRAPVAVQVHESGQHGQSSGVQHRFVFSGQCGQVLTDGGDLSVLYIQLHRPALGVDSVDEQHKITSLSVFVWFHRPGVSALRRAKKKNFSLQREKSEHQKRKHWSHSKNGCKLIFQFCTHHLGLHAPVSFSIRSFFDIF